MSTNVNPIFYQQPKTNWFTSGSQGVSRGTPVQEIYEPTISYTGGNPFSIPQHNQPSVEGGSTGYYGPELKGGLVGLNADWTF